jgi:hypothetical protein
VWGCIIGYWIWGRRVGRVGISLWGVGLGIEGGGRGEVEGDGMVLGVVCVGDLGLV